MRILRWFVNLFAMQLSDPDDYEVMFSCWMKQATLLFPVSGTIVLFDSRTQHRVRKSQKEPESLSLDGLLDPVK